MSSHVHLHQHDHDHDHGSGYGHGHHGHAHSAAAPHPPMALPPSFMRLSAVMRVGIALLASAVLWCAVWLAMR